MNLKTIKSLAVTSAIIAGVAAFGTSAVYAATSTTSVNGAAVRPNPMASFITAISQKFNLNQADVQKVVDELETQKHAEMDAQRAAEQKTRLAQAVTDGKITQAQSDLITAKQAEMKTFMESLKDKTEAERQTAMKTKTDEVKAWATANNIPEQFAMLGGMGGRGGHGGRGPGGFGGGMGGPGGKGGLRGQLPAAQGTVTTPTQSN